MPSPGQGRRAATPLSSEEPFRATFSWPSPGQLCPPDLPHGPLAPLGGRNDRPPVKQSWWLVRPLKGDLLSSERKPSSRASWLPGPLPDPKGLFLRPPHTPLVQPRTVWPTKRNPLSSNWGFTSTEGIIENIVDFPLRPACTTRTPCISTPTKDRLFRGRSRPTPPTAETAEAERFIKIVLRPVTT